MNRRPEARSCAASEPGAKRAECGRSYFRLVGNEKNQVTRFRFESLDDRLLLGLAEELGDRRIEPRLGNAKKRQPLGFEIADKHRQLVDLLAAVLCRGPWRSEPADTTGRTTDDAGAVGGAGGAGAKGAVRVRAPARQGSRVVVLSVLSVGHY